MTKALHVLHIEDSDDDSIIMARMLRQSGYDLTLTRVDTAASLEAALHERVWDVVIADWNVPSVHPLSVMQQLKQTDKDLPFIIVSGSIGEEAAVEAMLAGANDYVMKNKLARLVPAIERELRETAARRRKYAVEQSLIEFEQRLELALDGGSIGIWDLCVPTGAVLYDAHWARMLGYDVQELAPHVRTWHTLLHPEDKPHALNLWDGHVQGQTPMYEAEFRLLAKGGEYRWILSRGKVVERDATGSARRAIGMHMDITKRKHTEEALAVRSKALMRSNAELEQFVYVASHDLKEPLRMVSNFCGLLQRRYKGQLDSTADEYIDYAVEGAARMHALLEDLVKFSRVGTRGNPFKPHDCNAILATACSNLKIAIDESGSVIEHDPLPTVTGDGLQLVQVFQNLIGNAIKYRSPAHPEIHVGASRQDQGWVISIRDNGIGFDQAFSERIFVIFQRLHSRLEYPGTGMGLAICKKIVERHGGKIWCESKLGHGSTFFFSIPDGHDVGPSSQGVTDQEAVSKDGQQDPSSVHNHSDQEHLDKSDAGKCSETTREKT
ncbi:MAG: ATP-binding protein [Nitrospira sp.]